MYVSSWPGLGPRDLLLPERRARHRPPPPFPIGEPTALYAHVARSLLYHLFKALDLGPDEKVLVPNYHHGNEVRAIRAAGAQIRFYPILRNLEPDLDALRRLATPDCRVLVVIHYLGWPQPIEALMELAAERGLIVVEDCALSFLSKVQERPLGSFGDFGLFCPYKTVPIPNGGVLVQNTGSLPGLERLKLRPPDLTSIGARSLEILLETLQSRAPLLGKNLRRLKGAYGSFLNTRHVRRLPVGDTGFDVAACEVGISPLSLWLLKRFDYTKIYERRRAAYRALELQLADHVTLLDKPLAPGVCPLFFPILVPDKREASRALAARGISAIEFWNNGDPEASGDGAEDALFLRRHVLELPVHQHLDARQIDGMVDAVRSLGLRMPRAAPRLAGGEAARGLVRFEASGPDRWVQELRGGPELIAQLASEWRSVCDEGPSAAPFHRPEWISAYLDAFEADAALTVFTVRDGRGALRGVLPMIEELALVSGLPVRRLRAPANAHSCRFDAAYGQGEQSRVAQALWRHLRSMQGWDLIEAHDVPEGGALHELLGLAAGDGWPKGWWRSLETPIVPIPSASEGGDAVLWMTHPKFRANLRRRRKKLETHGPLQLRRFAHADRAVLRTFFELELSGWKGRGGSAILQNPAALRFYERIARWAEAEGTLAIYVLECGGRAVAMHLGLSSGGTYYMPKVAYAEDLAECSPGQLLVEDVLRDLQQRGADELDFLGPWMEWKADWTRLSRSHGFAYVYGNDSYGWALRSLKFEVAPAVRAGLDRLRATTTPLFKHG